MIHAWTNGAGTDYLYDYNGERTLKRGVHGETWYADKYWQVQNGHEVAKQIFVGDTRVVTRLEHDEWGDWEFEQHNIFYYHPDHLGSTTYVTKGDGDEWEHLEYTPYGEQWIDEGSDRSIIGYRFTSKEYDTETGLYYFGARYLDPTTSRWMSADPAMQNYLPTAPATQQTKNQNLPGQGGVFNPMNLAVYYYSSNNPIKYSDPNGSFPVDAASVAAVKRNVDNLVRAQDVARANPDYQHGAGGPYHKPDPSNTWCNLATYDVAEATGIPLTAVIGSSPKMDTKANEAALHLATGILSTSPAGMPAKREAMEITPKQAYALANEGWTVIAAAYNPGDHGHLATVRPTDQPYDPELGPEVSNVGKTVGLQSSAVAFGAAYAAGKVHYYYDPHQALPSSKQSPE